MAKITDYPSITTIDANTILLADGSSGTGKILASDMAKYALETYAGSTLAGSAQSVKSAFSSIFANAWSLTGGTVVPNGADLNTYTTPGNYYSYDNITVAHSPAPSVTRGFVMKVESSGGQLDSTYVRQTFRFYNNNNIYVRYSINTGFTAWELIPTRAEVDALGKKSAWISSTLGWVAIAANSSKTFDVPNVSKAIIIVMQGASVNNYGMYFLNATGGGAVTTKAISDNTNATISTATNKVTITTGAASGNSYVTFLVFGGTGITEA